MPLLKFASSIFGYKVDPDELDAYRTVIPTAIQVHINNKDGHYTAKVTSIDSADLKGALLITEAEGVDDLVTQVNDLVLTYKNVPERLRPYFKQILKPEDLKPSATEMTLVKA